MSQGRTILAQKGAEKAIKIPVLFDNLGNESTSNQTILKLNDFSHKHSAPCALIIPGIEGMVGNNFFNLAKTLKMEVFALQLSITSSEPDILAIANEVFEVINPKSWTFSIWN